MAACYGCSCRENPQREACLLLMQMAALRPQGNTREREAPMIKRVRMRCNDDGQRKTSRRSAPLVPNLNGNDGAGEGNSCSLEDALDIMPLERLRERNTNANPIKYVACACLPAADVGAGESRFAFYLSIRVAMRNTKS